MIGPRAAREGLKGQWDRTGSAVLTYGLLVQWQTGTTPILEVQGIGASICATLFFITIVWKWTILPIAHIHR